MRRVRGATFLLLGLVVAGGPAAAQVELEQVLPPGGVARPVELRHAPDGSGLFAAAQAGRLYRIEGGAAALVLTITDRVFEAAEEGGVLSFAFHPDYAENGHVFVEYVSGPPRRTVVSRFTRSEADPAVFDPQSEVVLLEAEQAEAWQWNHNGGSIAFGPDGYLYVALGDGGCCGDPQGNGQDLSTLLGKVIRLDVDAPGPELPYGIPPDNPFADAGWPVRPEIWAWGFRSPWRFSFDAETGALWLGDVGDNTWEEVDLVEGGRNYGWAVMEGAHCFPPGSPCEPDGLTLPVWEYGREHGRSVTGGYVYRGSALPSLVGKYVYGDFISGTVWALTRDPATGAVTNEELLATDHLLVSFGEDAEGELYVLGYFSGIHKLVPGGVSAEGPTPAAAASLRIAGPNPARGRTALAFRPARSGPVRLALFDVLGREVAVVFEGDVVAGEERLAGVDGAALPAGTYVARLEGPGAVRTRRLTFLR